MVGLSAAQAEPKHPLLGTPTVAPTPAEGQAWTPPPPPPETLDPQTALEDEAGLLRYIDANQGRLDVEGMAHPDIAKAMVQVLLRADRTFQAERVLYDATQKWPENTDLRRAWARVLISLGRPDAAKRALSKVISAAPEDATARYLLGLAWLRIEPRSAETDAQAVRALEAVVRLSPDYRDPDGMTGPALLEVIERLRRAGPR